MEIEHIPFNKPYISGAEYEYIKKAVLTGKISGNGDFTKRCHSFFKEQFNFKKCLLTTSCTDALEMAAILIDIKPGDEVIIPSYTFVSTANAFILRGAKLVFVDSTPDNPNIDVKQIESLITDRTRAIVPVHYAGIACDMDEIMHLADKYKIYVIEDAAQAIDSYYKGKLLGSIGHLAAFSFHETKNIQCGEGGLLVINDERFAARAEIIWEKGTNRSAFFRGEVDKYGWVDLGSSYLPSDILAAFLFAQLERIDYIQTERKKIWETYYEQLLPLQEKKQLKLPLIPEHASVNAHMFYVILDSSSQRDELIAHLKKLDVHAVFHYLSLHKSSFYENKHDGRNLQWSDHYSDRLLRLPFWVGLQKHQLSKVINAINDFFK